VVLSLITLYPHYYLVTNIITVCGIELDHLVSPVLPIKLNTTDSDNISNKVELRIQGDQAQYH
jgi:hypothetical protein